MIASQNQQQTKLTQLKANWQFEKNGSFDNIQHFSRRKVFEKKNAYIKWQCNLILKACELSNMKPHGFFSIF